MIKSFIPGAVALSLVAIATAADDAPAAKPDAAAIPAAQAPAAAPSKADSSYALGFNMGGSIKQAGLTMADLEKDAFLSGFVSAVSGEKPTLSEDKIRGAIQALGELVQSREKQTAAVNLAAGEKFLAENAKRKEVTTTKSGLQYEVITKGGDEKYVAPKEGDKDAKEKQFLVKYKGTLIDGKQFDASPDDTAVPMSLQVVEGFKEALTTMPVGAKWKLYLPAKLAYGDERRSADIGPNSTLIFELELVKIQDAPPAPQGGMPFPMPQGGE